jgi:hypothetical protein
MLLRRTGKFQNASLLDVEVPRVYEFIRVLCMQPTQIRKIRDTKMLVILGEIKSKVENIRGLNHGGERGIKLPLLAM